MRGRLGDAIRHGHEDVTAIAIASEGAALGAGRLGQDVDPSSADGLWRRRLRDRLRFAAPGCLSCLAPNRDPIAARRLLLSLCCSFGRFLHRRLQCGPGRRDRRR